MLIKKCSRCKKYRFTWQYNKNKAKKDGLQYQCRPCQHDYHNKEWYPSRRNHQIKMVKRNKFKRRHDNYKKVVEEYFVNGCVDCGEKDIQVLEFDHVRGIKKRVGYKGSEGVSYLIRHGYKWETVQTEIDKCEVRCRNCHKKRTWKENNYYSDLEEIINNNGTNSKGAS